METAPLVYCVTHLNDDAAPVIRGILLEAVHGACGAIEALSIETLPTGDYSHE